MNLLITEKLILSFLFFCFDFGFCSSQKRKSEIGSIKMIQCTIASLKMEGVTWQKKKQVVSRFWELSHQDFSPSTTRNWILPTRIKLETDFSQELPGKNLTWPTPCFQALCREPSQSTFILDYLKNVGFTLSCYNFFIYFIILLIL